MKRRHPCVSIYLGILCFLSFCSSSLLIARDYVIFAIHQDVPMGTVGEKIVKNYFVNIGQVQGIREGSILNVYRLVSQLDPYQQNKKLDFKILLGHLRVVHLEQESLISEKILLSEKTTSPQGLSLDIKDFMIGDSVDIQLESSEQ
jgi:hypothetical protein